MGCHTGAISLAKDFKMSALQCSGPNDFLRLLHWKTPLTSSTVMEIMSNYVYGLNYVFTFIEVGGRIKTTEKIIELICKLYSLPVMMGLI